MENVLNNKIQLAHALEALRDDEARYRLIFDSNPLPLWLYDIATLRFIDVNPATERLYGYTREEFMALSVLQLRPPDQIPVALNLIYSDRDRNVPVRFVHCKKNGTAIHVEAIALDLTYAKRAARLAIIIDVTERDQMMERLRESEERLRLALQAADLVPWSFDLRTGKIEHGERSKQILPDNHQVGGGLLHYVHPDDQPLVSQTVAAAIQAKRRYGMEFRILPPDGPQRWISSYGQVVCNQDEQPILLTGVSRDITAQKQLVEELEGKQKRLRLALDAAGMLVWSYDPVTGLIEQHDASPGVEANETRTLEEYLRYLHPADGPVLRAAVERAVRELASFQLDFRVASRKHGWRWRTVYVVPLQDAAGQLQKLTGVTYDINARKQSEASLQQTSDELRQRLSERQALMRRVVSAHEDERHRIARELHDETGQLLAAFKLELKLMSREEQANPRWQKLARMADQMGASLHALAFQLRPAGLDHLGLLPTLKQHIEDWQTRTGIPVDCQCVGLDHELRLAAELEIAIYRIVQEALTNIVKHAQAKNVAVILETRDAQQLRLIIEDDGTGFDPQAAFTMQRLGLLGIRERAELVGGSLEIESAPGRGTTLFLRLPFLTADTQGASAHA
jgi:PAS domain S-box-containing protein